MQFIDRSEIEVEGGRGGDGMVAYRREKYVPAGGPAGGDGGHGGAVVLEATANLQTLLDFKYRHRFEADDGAKGGPKNLTGAKGKDLVIAVPCGTVVQDAVTGETIGDLTEPGQRLVVAVGGRGGHGNTHFASNQNRAPDYATEGRLGQQRKLLLELKLLAEVGIIGLPNAGKSTLISVLSAARPRIADYPFTTLVPNLGVVRKVTGDGVVFADIPGLIEGAHQGVGLGHEFLRHIERTRVLVQLIALDSVDPLADYRTVIDELGRYGRELLHKPRIVALNKADVCLPEEAEHWRRMLSIETGEPVLVISAAARSNLDALLARVWQVLEVPQGVTT
ncbi:GTPase ObgE [Gloeobacter morelensis]|uniref:GTPase Obg n=1 Tax=Gloeobacter morelensis MG652769 TaxID=2781736 RepID=A0ABY3PQ75_9CYAN|nr:GTPase ObgE [Gloeobacter morelensis]UFP95770.1 GTPase ObgE [Gloeobacter morelensis MG652769]